MVPVHIRSTSPWYRAVWGPQFCLEYILPKIQSRALCVRRSQKNDNQVESSGANCVFTGTYTVRNTTHGRLSRCWETWIQMLVWCHTQFKMSNCVWKAWQTKVIKTRRPVMVRAIYQSDKNTVSWDWVWGNITTGMSESGPHFFSFVFKLKTTQYDSEQQQGRLFLNTVHYVKFMSVRNDCCDASIRISVTFQF